MDDWFLPKIREEIGEMEIHSYYLKMKDSKQGVGLLPNNDGGKRYNQANRDKFYYNFVIREQKESFLITRRHIF